MKRSRRWLLIFTAIVGLMAHAGALRPPSLRFNKAAINTSTSTTESPLTSPSSTAGAEDETAATEELSTNDNDTATKLTGIPQIDYVWDPNLPRELNGFNLSAYPFYSLVPPEKDIDFKCDGLHDGFYASIKHKCQIYHHCIYGIRHDFLCANYTAFDQKTFICQFVSEVDCKNSEKYFFRNDALYKATTTSTTTTTTTTTVAPPPQSAGKRPFRRPFRRRRPVDYYYDEEYEDDYYEERVNRRQKQRPRPRRPDYEEDYEDEMYEKRPMNRERNRGTDDYSYDRRPMDRSSERPERPRHRNRPSDSRRHSDEEDRFAAPPPPPPPAPSRKPGKPGKRRRPVVDDYVDDERDSGRRFSSDRRPHHSKPSDEDNTKFSDSEDDRRPPPPPPPPAGGSSGRRRKGGHRRPIYDDEEEADEVIARPQRRDPPEDLPSDDDKSAIVTQVRTSGSGSLFERPRTPPRIAPPVPLNEKKKYTYAGAKKAPVTSTTPKYDEEYYDDYEEPAAPAPQSVKKIPVKFDKFATNSERSRKQPIDSPVAVVKEDPKNRYETVVNEPIVVEEVKAPVQKAVRMRPSSGNFRPTAFRDEEPTNFDIRFSAPPSSPAAKNSRDNYEAVNVERERVQQTSSRFAVPNPPPPPAPAAPKNRDNYAADLSQERDNEEYKQDTTGNGRDVSRPVVRVIKRPFLPSRGGSPYLPRGLQPVGVVQKPLPTESTPIDMGSTVAAVRFLEHGPPLLRANNEVPPSNPSAPIISRPSTDPDDYPPLRHHGPRTTQRPQIDEERATLEKLYESEYDVTLNDALNPTLKPITRGLPSGFGNSPNFGGRFSSIANDPFGYRDSLYSSSDSRQTAVKYTNLGQRSTSQSTRQHQQPYYDYEY